MSIKINARKTAITGLTAITLAATSGLALADNDGASAVSTKASSQAQGLYSADQLMDADVYAKGDSKNSIGEIDDVLLDNGMTIKKFVIETKGKLGLIGGKSYVVSPSDITVTTESTDHASKPEYRISLDMTRDQLGKQPLYSDSWWTNAQSQASNAWQQTKDSASSAWTSVKNATSNIFNGTEKKAGNTADSTSNAADNAGNKASNAADAAGNKASNAADRAGNSISNAADKTSNAASEATNKASNAAANGDDDNN